MAADATLAEPAFVAARPERVRAAFALARELHSSETRKGDGAPFIAHPLLVAELLDREGCDDAVVAAALLHDVVENTDTAIGEVVERFGVDVGELVAAMTEDERIDDYEQRKDLHRRQVAEAGERAARIYVADKLANLRDMRALYARVGESASERFTAPNLDARVRAWARDTAMATRLVPAFPPLEDLRAELAGFEQDRAEQRGATTHA